MGKSGRESAMAYAAVHRMREDWMRRAVAYGMSHEQAARVLVRAVAVSFPSIAAVAVAAGFMLGWFVHG